METRNHNTPAPLNDGSMIIRGIAIVFNQQTWTGRFYELIKPEAVTDKLLTYNVRALFNHDPNKILGSIKSGTLRLLKTDTGLEYSIDLPNTSTGRNVYEMIKRGDISGSSFTFNVAEDTWIRLPNGKKLRTITKFKKIGDVGPVTYPAYEQTSAKIQEQHTSSYCTRKLKLISINNH